MPFKKGQSGNPKGRAPGAVNKTTSIVKAGITAAYEGMGGDAAFQKWAQANPSEFYTKVLVKLVPAEMRVSDAEGGDLIPKVTRIIHTFTPDDAPDGH
jgi:hypothetical protein